MVLDRRADPNLLVLRPCSSEGILHTGKTAFGGKSNLSDWIGAADTLPEQGRVDRRKSKMWGERYEETHMS